MRLTVFFFICFSLFHSAQLFLSGYEKSCFSVFNSVIADPLIDENKKQPTRNEWPNSQSTYLINFSIAALGFTAGYFYSRYTYDGVLTPTIAFDQDKDKIMFDGLSRKQEVDSPVTLERKFRKPGTEIWQEEFEKQKTPRKLTLFERKQLREHLTQNIMADKNFNRTHTYYRSIGNNLYQKRIQNLWLTRDKGGDSILNFNEIAFAAPDDLHPVAIKDCSVPVYDPEKMKEFLIDLQGDYNTDLRYFQKNIITDALSI